MVRVAFTGEVITNPCVMVGVQFKQGHAEYARPGMAFPLIGAMNEDWFNTYGKNYYGLVEQEEETEDWYLLAMVPVDSKSPTVPAPGYDRNYYLLSHFLSIQMDDINKILTLKHLETGTVLTIDETGITLSTQQNVDIAAGNNLVTLDDAGVTIGANAIFLAGGNAILTAKIPGALAINDVSEISISKIVKAG